MNEAINADADADADAGVKMSVEEFDRLILAIRVRLANPEGKVKS